MESRLYKKYKDEVKPALQTERGYANVHQIPGLDKIVVRMGVDATLEKSALDDAVKDMTTITGRKPVIDKSRKAVSNFKLREGQAIGCHVTLHRRSATYSGLSRHQPARL